MRGYIDVNQLPPMMGDEEENVERLQAECLNREEVGRPDTGSMVFEEGPP